MVLCRVRPGRRVQLDIEVRRRRRRAHRERSDPPRRLRTSGDEHRGKVARLMAGPGDPEASDGWIADLRARLDELLDAYRTSLHDSLVGLTEDEARMRL